jgi:hypothetical protein
MASMFALANCPRLSIGLHPPIIGGNQGDVHNLKPTPNQSRPFKSGPSQLSPNEATPVSIAFPRFIFLFNQGPPNLSPVNSHLRKLSHSISKIYYFPCIAILNFEYDRFVFINRFVKGVHKSILSTILSLHNFQHHLSSFTSITSLGYTLYFEVKLMISFNISEIFFNKRFEYFIDQRSRAYNFYIAKHKTLQNHTHIL